MISFLRDEMEKSREHELKLFQLKLSNRANSGMPPSSSMDTRFYPSMPSSLGAQQTTKERMSEGSYGNPFLYGYGKYQTLLCRTESIFIYILQPQSFQHSQLLFAKSLTYPNGKTHQRKTKPKKP